MAGKRLGSGYHPMKIDQALRKLSVDFDRLGKTTKKKSTAKRSTATKSVYRRGGLEYNDIFKWDKSGVASIDNMLKLFVDDVTKSLKGKGRLWAVETRTMMREVSPVLTGNLRDSVKILSADNVDASTIGEKLEVVDKNRVISYIVGISEKAILPPPHRKHIIRGPREGQMHTMSNFNYAKDANNAILLTKSEGYQGYDFLEKWQEIAKRNMERIF